MIDSKSLSKNFNKIKKLSAEEGISVVLKKIGHTAKKKLSRPADQRTRIKRDVLFKDVNFDLLTGDIENFFSSGLFRDPAKIKSDLKMVPAGLFEGIINEADKILNDEFTIYGQLNVSFANGCFSWCRDPLTNFEWPQKLSYVFIRSQKPVGTDIKTVWEIARFQFLAALAYAYHFTEDQRYASFALSKVLSWIDENSFQCGPHWVLPMEASIRLINWCAYLPLLDIKKLADHSLMKKVAQSIFEHLIFIRENLEITPSQAGNHYLSNLVGLLTARLLFPSFSYAVECTEFGVKQFEKEVQSQFNAVGINFEGSLAYHRLSSEICLVGTALIKRNALNVSAELLKRFIKIADFTKFYTAASKECPIIGDNDSGLYLKYFSGQDSNQHGYLGILFDLILEGEGSPQNFSDSFCSVHFVKTKLCKNSFSYKQGNARAANLQVKEFDGLIIARYQSQGLFFNTLNSSQGHTHNDKLSIYPVIDDKLLFIDRGSYSYTGFPAKRDEDRGTCSHNGPIANGWEQSRIWEMDPFYISGEAKCYSTYDVSGDELTITGRHGGYARYQKGMQVFRMVQWNTKMRTMLITDWLEGNKSFDTFNLTLFFLVNPVWKAQLNDTCLILNSDNHAVYFENQNGINMQLGEGTYCPSYSTELSCQTLKALCKVKIGDKISFLLRY